ncbi:MAG: hypothetical protein JNM27_16400 [Leptospirales bacterium]|nr:hypothetical protein [Leptospirales bacterium]
MKFLPILVLIAAFSACNLLGLEKEEQTDNTMLMALAIAAANSTDSTQCTTDVVSFGSGNTTYLPLCSPSAGVGRFFTIQGINVPASNAFGYIFLGYSSAPTSSSTFQAGQYAVVAGKSAGATDSFTFLRNAATVQYDPAAPAGVGVNTPNIFATGSTNQEICYEAIPGAGVGPRIVVWYTGTNGANCSSRSGLTLGNAVLNYNSWADASTNTLTLGQAFYRFSNTASFNAARIVVSSRSNF